MLVQNLKLPERLAKTHLRIEFLLACRKCNLKSRFINDALRPVTSVFSYLPKFDVRCSGFSKYLLNASISKAFQERSFLERLQGRLYRDLCTLNLRDCIYNWVKNTGREILHSTIAWNRPRLERKFFGLKRRNQDRETQDSESELNVTAFQDRVADVKRVNNLSSAPLDSITEQLLSQGPKFSITPSVNSIA